MRPTRPFTVLSACLAVAGCRPAPTGPTGAPECVRLDATPAVPDLLPLSMAVTFPAPVHAPPPHGGILIDAPWASDREVYGARGGTARFAWADGGRVQLDLQPMPRDVGVQFVGQTDYGDTDGGVMVMGWSGAWIVSGDEGGGDTVGTFVMTRGLDASDCD